VLTLCKHLASFAIYLVVRCCDLLHVCCLITLTANLSVLNVDSLKQLAAATVIYVFCISESNV